MSAAMPNKRRLATRTHSNMQSRWKAKLIEGDGKSPDLVVSLLQSSHCVLAYSRMVEWWRQELQRILNIHRTPLVQQLQRLLLLLWNLPVNGLEKFRQSLHREHNFRSHDSRGIQAQLINSCICMNRGKYKAYVSDLRTWIRVGKDGSLLATTWMPLFTHPHTHTHTHTQPKVLCF